VAVPPPPEPEPEMISVLPAVLKVMFTPDSSTTASCW